MRNHPLMHYALFLSRTKLTRCLGYNPARAPFSNGPHTSRARTHGAERHTHTLRERETSSEQEFVLRRERNRSTRFTKSEGQLRQEEIFWFCVSSTRQLNHSFLIRIHYEILSSKSFCPHPPQVRKFLSKPLLPSIPIPSPSKFLVRDSSLDLPFLLQ